MLENLGTFSKNENKLPSTLKRWFGVLPRRICGICIAVYETLVNFRRTKTNLPASKTKVPGIVSGKIWNSALLYESFKTFLENLVEIWIIFLFELEKQLAKSLSNLKIQEEAISSSCLMLATPIKQSLMYRYKPSSTLLNFGFSE